MRPRGALSFLLAAGAVWLSGATTSGFAEPAPAAPAAGTTEARPEAAAKPKPPILFEEIGEAAGVRFVHSPRDFDGRYKHQVLEMFTDGGAAAAVGDFDGDGDDDLFIVDSDEGKAHHLMRNDGVRNGIPTFTEITDSAGVGIGNDARSIVADALFFDHDNDGRLDLLLGRFGTPLLLRNLGPDDDGVWRFEDVSEAAGLDGFANTIGVVAFDADADGFLDLMLANYFPPENLLHLETKQVLPNNLDYADNGGGVTFYRSVAGEDGSRRFVDQTEASGLAHHTGWSLDIGHADLDNDGDQDVYVAGDYGTDRLFLNDGVSDDGTVRFRDVTEEAMGFDTRKGMNVDMGDYNRDGWLDIYVTNITDDYMKECNFLWHNNGVLEKGEVPTFFDVSRETGTCDTDWGWAAKWADFDNDGWEDIFAVNGLRSAGEQNYIPVLLETTILRPDVDFSSLDSYPDIGDMTWSGYQKQRLFRNLGDGTFVEMGEAAGVDNDLDGRGVAIADFDQDGRLDIFQSNVRQPSLLYRGISAGPSAEGGHWLQLRLVGSESNRDAIGARVVVHAGGETFLREVNGGNAYSSQSTTRLHFGLGKHRKIDKVEIRWPSGRVEELTRVPIDDITRVVEGLGISSDQGS